MKEERKHNLPERESRFLAEKIEIRAGGESEEPAKVFGYAAVFNSPSHEMRSEHGPFRELVMPGAFDTAIRGDVRALWNHDENIVLARSKNGEGTLKLGTDERGLWYEFEAPDTQAGRDLLTSLRRGDIDASSFGFRVGKDKWERRSLEAGKEELVRSIESIEVLYDVSPVPFPAYAGANVSIRSLNDFIAEERSTQKEESDNSAAIAWAAFDGFATPPAQQNND